MKHLTILFLALFIFGCTSEKETIVPTSEEQMSNERIINYTFNNITYQVRYTLDGEEQMVPIEDQSLQAIKDIVEDNESLILHYLEDNNYILFQSSSDLEKHLAEMGTPLANNSLSNKISDPYTEENLQMFIDSYFGGYHIYWGYPSPSESVSCFQNATPEERLKNFNIPSNWEVLYNIPAYCYMNNSGFNNNPNDKVSSVRVYNVFAQFYEDANYGGKSITRDARYGQMSAFNRLKSVGMGLFGNWDNEISSVKLSY